jgi:hypothetical protein
MALDSCQQCQMMLRINIGIEETNIGLGKTEVLGNLNKSNFNILIKVD